MKIRSLFIFTAICLTTITSLPTLADTYQACSDLVKKIERVEQRMRQGYTVPQGERLKSRLKKLKTQRNRCERNAEKAQSKSKKSKRKQNLNTQSLNTNNTGTWQYSQTSPERLEYWKAQQAIENKRIKALNNKYKDVIKDSNTASSVNDNQ